MESKAMKSDETVTQEDAPVTPKQFPFEFEAQKKGITTLPNRKFFGEIS